MGHRKDIYVDKLGLIPLPNGGGCQGYFAETYRSSETLQVEGSEGNDRSIFTTIYYLMAPELGGMNFLHSNKSDTVHYFHDGWPAKYVLVSPSEGKVKEYIPGRDVTKGHVPQLLVPGGFLKAGKILVKEEEYAMFPGETPFTLMSQQVSPGFDYRDYHVLDAAEVKNMFPELWPTLDEYMAPKGNNAPINSKLQHPPPPGHTPGI